MNYMLRVADCGATRQQLTLIWDCATLQATPLPFPFFVPQSLFQHTLAED